MHDATQTGRSQPPGLELNGDLFVVTLDACRPAIASWRVRATGENLPGDPGVQPPVFTVYSVWERRVLTSLDQGVSVSYAVTRPRGGVDYAVLLRVHGEPAVELHLVFTLGNRGLTVALDRCTEHEGWQFLHLDVPRVVSAHTAFPGTRMVIGTFAGRLIDPATCGDGALSHRYDWIRNAFSTVGLVYGPHLTAVVRLSSLDDTMLSSVRPETSGRSAGLGVQLRYRYAASEPAAQFCPHPGTRFDVDLVARDTGAPERGWVVGARYVHSLYRNALPDIYRNRFVYKIYLASPAGTSTTFEQALDLVREIHHLTDGGGQVAYLVGFQRDGHDTGYPDIFTENEKIGGRAGLLRLIEEARALNAVVSFHDNYDDVYQSSPAWDPEDVSIDAQGELQKGGFWAGGQAYVVSMPAYARNKAPERIRRTLERYPIRESYHIDVLSAAFYRLDFRKGRPVGQDEDMQARLDIIRQFRDRGIDVTSEGVGLLFLEQLRYAYHLRRRPERIYPGDKRIPFGAFIAHGHLAYGGSLLDSWSILDGLLYGSFDSKDFTGKTDRAEILDAHYLLQAPLNLLRDEAMIDYAEAGAIKRVTYTNNCFVEVDFENLEFEVSVKGVTVAKDFISFAPGGRDGSYRYYRGRWVPEGLAWELPEAWRGAQTLTAVALTRTGAGERRQIPVKEGRMVWDGPVGVPFRILPCSKPEPRQ